MESDVSILSDIASCLLITITARCIQAMSLYLHSTFLHIIGLQVCALRNS